MSFFAGPAPGYMNAVVSAAAIPAVPWAAGEAIPTPYNREAKATAGEPPAARTTGRRRRGRRRQAANAGRRVA